MATDPKKKPTSTKTATAKAAKTTKTTTEKPKRVTAKTAVKEDTKAAKTKSASGKATATADAKPLRAKPGTKAASAKEEATTTKPRRASKPRSTSEAYEPDVKKRKPLNYAFNTEKDSEEKPKRKPATRRPAPAKAGRPTTAKSATGRPTRKEGPTSQTREAKGAGKTTGTRTERSDRTERTDRTGRSERPDRTERPDRGERTQRSDRAERTERTDKRSFKPTDKPTTGRTGKSTTPIVVEDKNARPPGKKPHRKGSYDPSRKRSFGQKPGQYRDKRPAPARKRPDTGVETIRLNRYIANAGIASRREADELIRTGLVEVNGKTITEMGYQVQPGDVVRYAGDKLNLEKPIYIVLNKPKDYITSGTESETRRSVFQLLRGAGQNRMWPVGRMDRNTTGLLLFTNDDALTKKLTMPRQGIKKIYHIFTDKNVKKEHLEAMIVGVDTPDGWLKVSSASHVSDAKDKKQVGIEVNGGRSRLARMIFEHFGYQVLKLDRVIYAGLTKKDLTRGRWRHLTAQEVTMLKML